ncbi:MAG: hypothetical protein JSV36_08235, partial [Anaerolineae bacterium]
MTVPDNAGFLPGQSFVKTWRLLNSGTCTWTADYALVLVSGNSMGGPGIVPLPGSVAPGSTVDLSVSLTAPPAPGTYRGYWQLRSAEGRLFGVTGGMGPAFWVQIVVNPTATPTPVMAGWRGEYYGNCNLAGKPLLVRNDPAVDFDWGRNPPAAGLPSDGFSARWTRTIAFEEGLYR